MVIWHIDIAKLHSIGEADSEPEAIHRRGARPSRSQAARRPCWTGVSAAQVGGASSRTAMRMSCGSVRTLSLCLSWELVLTTVL
jgi:hypothetical protein